MRLLSRMSPWLLCAGLAACGGNPPATPGGGPVNAGPAPTPAPTAEPAETGERWPAKPGAPVELTMEARALPGTATSDRFEIVLRAVPQRAADRLELAIDGHPAEVMTATAGAPSEARTTVDIARGAGKDVIGTAVMIVDGRRMGAATQIRIGAPAPEAPAGTIIQLPDGTRVQEVRP